MSAITDTIRNGVDTEQLFATLDLIKAQPELAQFQFRAANRWIDGAHNRSTIKGFYAAGGEDTTRGEAFEIDAGEPAILLGTDTGAQPGRVPAARARRLPDDGDRLRRRRAQGAADVGRVDPDGDIDVRGAFGRRRRGAQRVRAHRRVVPREGRRAGGEAARGRRARPGALGRLRHRHQRRARRGRGDTTVGAVRRRMPIELAAIELTATEAGARLVAIAEELSEELAAHAAEHDRDGSYPFEAIDALKAAGYFAAPVPVELGGLGVTSAHDLVVASSRLARGDASVAIGVNMHLVAVLNMERRRQVAVAAGADRRARGFASSLEQIARDGVVLAAAVSERGQDLTRPGTHRHSHRGRLADRRPQDVLHDVPRRHRSLRRRHLCRRGGHRALRLRHGAHRRARRRGARRLGRARDARLGQQLDLARGRRAARIRGARRLPRRRPAALHGAQPRRRAVPRRGLARHRRVGRRDRPPRHRRAHQRRRAPAHAGGRQRRRPRRVARRPVARGRADRRAPRRQPGVRRQRRASSTRCSPRPRRPRRSSTRRPPASWTARSRSPAAPATSTAARSHAPTATSRPARSCTRSAPIAPTTTSADVALGEATSLH